MKNQKARCIHMTDDDWLHLGNLAKASGCSRSSYIRRLIYLKRPKPLPSPDYRILYRELAAIGNNINQIAKSVHLCGEFNAAAYKKDVEVIYEIQRKLSSIEIEPEMI